MAVSITQKTPSGAINLQTIADLYKKLVPQYETAAAGERARYKSGLSNLQQVADLFGKSYTSGAERSALAGAEQTMTGRGLSGTTRPGAVSAGMKAGFEDIRKKRLADALKAMATYKGGWRSQFAPTPGTLSHLATGGFSGLLSQQRKDLEMIRLAEAMNQADDTSGGGIGSLGGGFGGGSYGGGNIGNKFGGFLGGGTGGGITSGGGKLSSAIPSGPTTTTTDTESKLPDKEWFNWQDPLSFEGLDTGETSKGVPHTASLYSRYNRWKKAFKKQNPNIPENNIAPYEVWYEANIRPR